MKVAIVTGASSGFGRQICLDLIKIRPKIRVVAIARRADKLGELAEICGKRFLPVPLDITDFSGVDEALDSLPGKFRNIDLLINNAGLAKGIAKAYEADFQGWQTMIDTNIRSLIFMTHRILPQMVKRRSGTIINLGSVAGSYPYTGGNIYGATKAFVQQFSMNLRADLIDKRIRVSNIEPGMCGDTEFSLVRFDGDKSRVDSLYKGVKFVTPKDISKTVVWIYSMPDYFNVNRIEIMPTAQAATSIEVYRKSTS